MTNEDKERLKGRIYRWYQFASHHTSPSGTSEDREILVTILSLIDRVPSEEEAKDAWAFLHELVETCIDCRGIPSCEHCDSYEICAGGPDRHLETIHRALGFDETGYSSRLREEDE